MIRLLPLLLLSLSAFAHPATTSNYPKNYFGSPIDAPLVLAGNFGELRPNHFHAGIDITTNGKEGVAIFAAADGYVSRIRVSPVGYGKAVYVTHPNGYTTVYGHLRTFNTAIGTYAEQHQYEAELFEIDLTLLPDQLPVKKGQIIARSGNSGGSGGPHLHFEIRDTKTEDALNPLLFGLAITDKVAPTLVRVALIPLDANACINGKNATKSITLKQVKGIYVPATAADTLPRIHGRIGVAVDAYDKETVAHGKNGIYSVRLSANGKAIFASHFERIPFVHSRYINCYIDYTEYQRSKKYLHCSFVPPNNLLPIYDTLVNSGELTALTNQIIRLKYVVADAFGNRTTATFSVHSRAEACAAVPIDPAPFQEIIAWDTTSFFESSGQWSVTFPARAVYAHTPFRCTFSAANPARPVIVINSRMQPLHLPCTVRVVAAVPEALRSKVLLAEALPMASKAGGYRYASVGGVWRDGAVETSIKNFGRYEVLYDTLAPTIKPGNFDLNGKKQSNLAALSTLQFTIDDKLSGIRTYRTVIDGKWILADYDAKNDRLTIALDQVATGKHELQLEVTDKCGNRTIYTKSFSR